MIKNKQNWTILVYMILNGKGNQLAVVYIWAVLFPFLFNRSLHYSCWGRVILLQVFCVHVYMIVVSEYYSRAEEQCRTSSSESRVVEGSLSIWKKNSNMFIGTITSTYASIVDCINVHVLFTT